MSQCTIYLENYTGVYYTGSEIKGWLDCYFDEETTVRGIKIRLMCTETNEFTDVETYTDPVHHTRERRYKTRSFGDRIRDSRIMYNEQMLFGSDSGRRVMDKGTHKYHFTYILPSNMPSTFNGLHGCVFYQLEGVVDIPLGFDYEDELIFVVKSPIDFNKMSTSLQKGRTYSDEKTICCLCCKGGVITMDVTLPKRAFVPGEVINLQAAVSNMSNSNVGGLIIILTKTVILLWSLLQEDTIVSLNEYGISAHQEKTFDLQLTIPKSTQIPNFSICKLFQVSYKLQVCCEILACPLNLNIYIRDIIMGHIQCRGDVEDEGHEETNRISPDFMTNLLPKPPYLPEPPPPGIIYPLPGGDAYPPIVGTTHSGGYSNYSYPPSSYSAFTSVSTIGPAASYFSNANGPITDNSDNRGRASGEPSAPLESPPPE